MCCHVPGLFTRTIPAIVIPRKTSSETNRWASLGGGVFFMDTDFTDYATTRLFDRRGKFQWGRDHGGRCGRRWSLSGLSVRARCAPSHLRANRQPACRFLRETRVFVSRVFLPCALSSDRYRDSAG